MNEPLPSLLQQSRRVEQGSDSQLSAASPKESLTASSSEVQDKSSCTLRGIKITVAYDGTNYQGWQSQVGGRTIQDEVQRVASQVAGEKVSLHASGRTDAGVHALGQVVSFQTHAKHSQDVWMRAFSGHLPFDISVTNVEITAPEFHARKFAIRKRYRYLIYDGLVSEVLAMNYMWQTRRPLDFAAMHESAKLLLGTHDFASFESGGSRRQSTVRTVYEIKLWRPALEPQNNSVQKIAWEFPPLLSPEHLIVLEVEADGFLYNMVRTIVGTLVKVGCNNEPIDWPLKVLAARDRRVAGRTAPAQGLYLLRVLYPES